MRHFFIIRDKIMAVPSVIRINCTEVIQVTITDRIRGTPVSTAVVTVSLKNLDETTIPDSTVTLDPVVGIPGLYRGRIDTTITSRLTKGKRYILTLNVEATGGRLYAETEIEAVISKLE